MEHSALFKLRFRKILGCSADMHPDFTGCISSQYMSVMHQRCPGSVSCRCKCRTDASHSTTDYYNIIFSFFNFSVL